MYFTLTESVTLSAKENNAIELTCIILEQIAKRSANPFCKTEADECAQTLRKMQLDYFEVSEEEGED